MHKLTNKPLFNPICFEILISKSFMKTPVVFLSLQNNEFVLTEFDCPGILCFYL